MINRLSRETQHFSTQLFTVVLCIGGEANCTIDGITHGFFGGDHFFINRQHLVDS